MTNRLTYHPIQSLKPLKFLQPRHIKFINLKISLLFFSIYITFNFQYFWCDYWVILVDIFVSSMAFVEIVMMEEWIVWGWCLCFYCVSWSFIWNYLQFIIQADISLKPTLLRFYNKQKKYANYEMSSNFPINISKNVHG